LRRRTRRGGEEISNKTNKAGTNIEEGRRSKEEKEKNLMFQNSDLFRNRQSRGFRWFGLHGERRKGDELCPEPGLFRNWEKSFQEWETEPKGGGGSAKGEKKKKQNMEKKIQRRMYSAQREGGEVKNHATKKSVKGLQGKGLGAKIKQEGGGKGLVVWGGDLSWQKSWLRGERGVGGVWSKSSFP